MISRRATLLKPSPTLALAAKAAALKAEGKDVISLTVGEPDWDTYPNVKRAAIVAIENGQTKYSTANGTADLRKAIAQQTNGLLGTDYTENHVTVTAGGKFSIYCAIQALVDPGDEVIIPSPYWVSYPPIVELAEGKPVIVNCDLKDDFKITPEKLKSAITKKTKMVIFNSPSNPTGCVYSADEWRALGKVLLDAPHVTILSDDIYNQLNFEGGVSPHLLQVHRELTPRTVLINGASKTYAMTGWRLGWAIGATDVVKAITNLQSQTASCAAPFTQIAAKYAIEESREDLQASLRELKSRKDFIINALKTVPDLDFISPGGAFYVFPSIKKYIGKKFNDKVIANSKDFADLLLEHKLVAVVPGVEFGSEGYFRLSFVLNQSRMQQAVDRIRDFVSQLK